MISNCLSNFNVLCVYKAQNFEIKQFTGKSNEILGLNFFNLFFYLKIKKKKLIHERHGGREAETQAEGEAGFLQGAGCGTLSLIPGSCPGQTLSR